MAVDMLRAAAVDMVAEVAVDMLRAAAVDMVAEVAVDMLRAAAVDMLRAAAVARVMSAPDRQDPVHPRHQTRAALNLRLPIMPLIVPPAKTPGAAQISNLMPYAAR